MTKRRLGLDLGTNSIGWCLLDLGQENEVTGIFKCGVRIFSDGRDSKTKASLKAERTLIRSARRRRDRFVQRQKTLINALIKAGLMPSDEAERQALAFEDPYKIRKRALDNQVSPFEMGRAIFHLNQRRGFKSNRKSADNEAGLVKQSIAELEMAIFESKARTFGEYLADRHEAGKTVRARRFGQKKEDLYELYPNRAMLEAEFDKLWEAQARYQPELYNDTVKDHIKKTVFHQRKLKPQQVGKCTFLPDEDRAAKALPSFQRFRMYQELNNLCWIDREGRSHKITGSPSVRDRLFEELEKKRKMNFGAMRKILRAEGVIDFAAGFNLESEARKDLEGNLTSCEMRKDDRFGAEWDQLREDLQDKIITLLLDNEKEDAEVAETLISVYGLSQDKAEACLEAKLLAGYGALSQKAITQIVPVMRDQGLIYYEAVKEAGLGEANLYDENAPLSDRLDYYGKALSGHVIGGSFDPEETNDEVRYGIISNPTVHIALNQIRAVINEICRLYGKPHQIVIELARDLPMGADGKKELEKFQRAGLELNQKAKQKMRELGIVNVDDRRNLQKYKLWEQLSSDCSERCCPFTGKQISLSDLFSDKIEIEHLLPFSDSFDDSMANKTVCYRAANRDKGKRAPHEAFGHSPDGYDWQAIMERTKNFPKSKQWRFQPDAMKRFEEEGGFLGNQLNDTRYISRYTKQYLATIVPQDNIWVVTGRLTSLLRGHWGLNSLLSGHNSEDDDRPKKKARHDHRHHAVDAIVIAMTSRSMLQGVSWAAKRSEEQQLSRLFGNSIDPWEGFINEAKAHIDGIIISHRTRKKNQGSLHNDTAYGLVEHHPGQASMVVHRVPVDGFQKKDDILKIRDPLIQKSLLNETESLSGKDLNLAVQNWCQKRGIRNLRILEKISVIPIKNKKGEIYKSYKGDGNAYMEIYADPKTGKWTGEIVSRFDAAQKGFMPEWRKANPALKMVMRLRNGDMLYLADKDIIFRVQKMSGNQITLAPHNEANADARDRDKDDIFKFTYGTPSSLQKMGAVKVHISPTGLIQKEQ